MTFDSGAGSDDLDPLDQFVTAYAAAADKDAALADWSARYPHLADEFQLLAVFDALAALRVPEEVAGVDLLGPVGRGGMGLVYEGVERSVGRAVAVKLCPAVGDPAARERFLSECQTLAGLHQTSIVPILAAGRQGLWLYCVMPLIDGASLADLVRRARAMGGPLPPLPAVVSGLAPAGPIELSDTAAVRPGPTYLRSVAGVLAEAADAVAYAHQQGVWHLDLKPANLMLEETGHCWVIDFGLARAAGGLPAGDLERSYLTTAYAAPEQWAGGGDARSDVWGLGVTLYELLTLRRAFGGDAGAAGQAEVIPPRTLAPEVPRDLQAICLKALARRPEDRYPSASAFAADLRHWLDGEEPMARPWPPLVRVWDLARRHRAWAAAVAASLIGMTATLFFLWQGEQLRAHQAAVEADAAIARADLQREASTAARSRAGALVNQARDRLHEPLAGRRSDVRRLLRQAADAHRGVIETDDAVAFAVALRSVYAESLGTLDAREIPAAAGLTVAGPNAFAEWSVDIHPDGDRMAIGTARRPLIWRLDGPRPSLDPADAAGPLSRVVYGPKGSFLAEVRAPEAGGGLRVWDGGATRLLGEAVPAGGAGVVAVGFGAAEARLWAVRADGWVGSWELPSLAASGGRRVAEPPPRGVTAAAFGPGARVVALGDDLGRVVAYGSDGAVVGRFSTPSNQAVEALAWSPDARHLAVGGRDGMVHVFDRNGSPLYRVPVSAAGVGFVAFSPDGRWLTAHYRFRGAQVWDAYSGRLVLTGAAPIRGFSRNGWRFASANTHWIGYGDLLPPEVTDRFEGHLSSVEQLAWAPGGERLATLSSDFELRVWDVARPGAAVAVLAPPADGVWWAEQSAVALGPGGRQVAYASGGEKRSDAVVWDVATGRRLAHWELPGGFERLAPAGPGRFLSVREEVRPDTGNVFTTTRLLTVGEPAPAGRVIRSPEPADVRRFISHWLAPDGRHYLWTGPRLPAEDRRIELYDTATGSRAWQLRPGTESNNAAPLCILTADLTTLWVMDGGPHTYQYAVPPVAPPARVREAVHAVSPDGRWMLTALSGESGLLRAAALQRRGGGRWVEFRLRDRALPGGGRDLFSPDGRHLAWGTVSGSVVVIDLPALAERLEQFEAELAAGPGE